MAGKVLWNFRAKSGERIVSYFFALGFDDSRDIEAVTSRILKHFAPTDENQQRDGVAGNLKYRVLCFDVENVAPPEQSEFTEIFGGRIKKDERLYFRERAGLDGLESYARSELVKI
jgi:hypothetical protein